MYNSYYKLDEKHVARLRQAKIAMIEGRNGDAHASLLKFVNRHDLLADRSDQTREDDVGELSFGGLTIDISNNKKEVYLAFSVSVIDSAIYQSFKKGLNRLDGATAISKMAYKKSVFENAQDDPLGELSVKYIGTENLKLKAQAAATPYLTILSELYAENIDIATHEADMNRLLNQREKSKYEMAFRDMIDATGLLPARKIAYPDKAMQVLMKNIAYERDGNDQHMYLRMTNIALADPQLYFDLSRGMQAEEFADFFVKSDGMEMSDVIAPTLPPTTERGFVFKENKSVETRFYALLSQLKFFDKQRPAAVKQQINEGINLIFDFSVDEICNEARVIFQEAGVIPFADESQPNPLPTNDDILDLSSAMNIAILPNNGIAFSMDLGHLVKNYDDIFDTVLGKYADTQAIFKAAATEVTDQQLAEQYFDHLLKGKFLTLDKK